MKDQNLSFFGPDVMAQCEINRKIDNGKVFDWDKAASIIKEKLKSDPNLVAEAGLEGDWDYTGGVIFEGGEPVLDSYTYLFSKWATPTLIINDSESIPCFIEESAKSRFSAGSKWDEQSLSILKS